MGALRVAVWVHHSGEGGDVEGPGGTGGGIRGQGSGTR